MIDIIFLSKVIADKAKLFTLTQSEIFREELIDYLLEYERLTGRVHAADKLISI